MGGLLVLSLFYSYMWGAAKVVASTDTFWKKALVVLLAILIPTADAIYGRIKLKTMCEADAGLRIHRTVDNVAGFSTGESSPYQSWVEEYGYSYVEGYRFGKNNQQTITYLADASGKAVTKIEPKGVLRSRYLLTKGESDSRTYLRSWTSIVDLETNETMAIDTTIIFFGGWVERAIEGLYAARGTADYCPKDDHYRRLIKLVTHTLKPIPKELGAGLVPQDVSSDTPPPPHSPAP